MEIYSKKIKLTNENISEVTSELTALYLKITRGKAETDTKISLSIEELLLSFRDTYGSDEECRVTYSKFLKTQRLEISTDGEKKEWIPYDDEEQRIPYDILVRLGVKAKYYYSHTRKGKNRVIWNPPTAPRKNSMLISILIAMVLAIIGGILVNMGSASLKKMVVEEILTPFFDKFTAVLTTLATPLVFLAVIGGIIGIGDTASFGKIGSKFLKRMLTTYFVAALLIGVGCVFVYGISLAGEDTGGSAVGQIIKLVLDIVPDHILEAFAIDNDLQVITISIFVGVVMLMLGEKVQMLNDLIKEASDLVNKMMVIFCKCLPIIVFLGVFKLICSSSKKQFLSIGSMLGVFVVVNIVFFAFMFIRVRIVMGVSEIKLFPKQLATLLINLTTSSQVAALPEHMKCLKKKFGIDEKVVDFGLPLGMVVYMPSGAILLALTAYALCTSFGVAVTVSMAIKIIIVSVILAIAAPPLPGSAFTVLPILFKACGVPMEAFPIAIIFGSLMGYLCPALNGFNLQLELLMTAKKLGKVDEKALREKYIEKS